MRLSPAQKRNLVEMIGPDGGSLFWNGPFNGGVLGTLDVLTRLGLLRRVDSFRTYDTFELTEEGLKVALELKAKA